ncbi:purine-cytosine permease family protein [Actinomadura rayongensis]|uniref:purine-cytosine permease family protein n=1 Tax=Actinomadura rayongensis TaxID=1429076 RepID=UPI00192911FF|nr:cytosine permease [Actinomadura rayongensis]
MTDTTRARSAPDAPPSALAIEQNGLNVIPEDERKGRPFDLFWTWFASNVGVTSVAYGSFLLAYGVSLVEGIVAGVVGIALSFLLVGLASLAGKRGSAPTMVLSRAAFGVEGGRVPSFLTYVLQVGWETVTAVLAVDATASVFTRLGWSSGTATKLLAFAFVAVVIAGAALIGLEMIQRLQRFVTVATIVLLVGFLALTARHVHWSQATSLHAGGATAFVGALVFAFAGFGLGWTNIAADFSRYLPRSASGPKVVGWTTLGASIAPVVLVLDGLLLVGSNPDLNDKIAADPIGGLAGILPTWYLVPFVVVALLGLIGGSVLNIYSSGLAMLSIGVRVPRHVAVLIDTGLMVVGTIYVVWFSSGFLPVFTAFLITLGVPIAAWSGIFLADLLLRRGPYSETDLFDRDGRYGAANPAALAILAAGAAVGWGLVVNAGASWLSWQGYLLGPLGLGGTSGTWAQANVGVVVALAIGFLGYLALCGRRVRRQRA